MGRVSDNVNIHGAVDILGMHPVSCFKQQTSLATSSPLGGLITDEETSQVHLA